MSLDGRKALNISIRSARKQFGSFVALDDVSLEVGAGEFLTLLGPSGSGKTTLLNLISGFATPDRGAIFFGGEDVTARPVNQRGLGMVFQSYALFPHLTVGENIAFPLKVRRIAKAEVGQRVTAALQLVRLDRFADRSIASLSGGQRQRVALARAVVFSPQIVLMDEPLSALDKTLREQMQVEIRHLHAKIGATTIYVTHDQREALTMSDRIAVMNHGRVLQCDTPAQIYEHPRDAFVAGFIGETTLVPVTRSTNGFVIKDGGAELIAADAPSTGQDFCLVLRAERILMPEECEPGANRMSVVVRDAIYQGDSVLVLADLDGHTLSIRRPMRGRLSSLPQPGSHLTIGLARSDTIVVPALAATDAS